MIFLEIHVIFPQFERHTRSCSCIRIGNKKACIKRFPLNTGFLLDTQKEGFEPLKNSRNSPVLRAFGFSCELPCELICRFAKNLIEIVIDLGIDLLALLREGVLIDVLQRIRG